ncbi:stalk domain-containing protein [Moorellaceae bacterium AZ2]
MSYYPVNTRKVTRAVLSALILTLFFVLPVCAGETGAVQFTIGKSFYVIDGKTYSMDVVPYIKEGRTFLPLRYAAVGVGVDEKNVLWDDRTNSVVLIKGDRVVNLTAGSREITVNGVPSRMDVAPEIVPPGRLMLPVRHVAEALGLQVAWDQASGMVTIFLRSVPRPPPYKDFIEKEYHWLDPAGNEWTWHLTIPTEMYSFYRAQPRIHELLIKEYTEKVNELRRRAELLKQYMEYWYYQCQVQPGDSYESAWQKYLTYLQAYRVAQEELEKILVEYRELETAYRQAEYRLMRQGYVPYVLEEANYKLAEGLALKLAEKAPAGHRARIEFAAAFVQGAIPYVEETGEYPKYPVETLVEGGDCKDKSILLAAILKALGYRTALLVFPGNPGHMALGVECPEGWGSYYFKDGVKYYYLETTSRGWRLGEVPPEHYGKSALVYVVP